LIYDKLTTPLVEQHPVSPVFEGEKLSFTDSIFCECGGKMNSSFDVPLTSFEVQ
jgi:hypothetical protein